MFVLPSMESFRAASDGMQNHIHVPLDFTSEQCARWLAESRGVLTKAEHARCALELGCKAPTLWSCPQMLCGVGGGVGALCILKFAFVFSALVLSGSLLLPPFLG